VTQLILLGAGGHARVLIEALRQSGSAVSGFVTDEIETPSGNMAGMPRLGSDAELMTRPRDDVLLINGVGTVGDPRRRRIVFEKFHAAGFAFATVLHPSAVLAADAALGEGAQIMAGALVQPGASIGANAIINTGAVIDHDTIVGNHVHVAPGACLSGNVVVGASTHIGAGATVIQGIRIGLDALVAAGSVVVEDIAAGAVVMGVPARAKQNRVQGI
jgi:sugar O-acyltransferase (sialic acid O-acetyltransferase NeuD family)